MKRTIKRTKKGQFRKGTGGGPGRGKRKKITDDDILPVEIQKAFFKAFVKIFSKKGDADELVKFCEKNQLNMRLLISECRRLLPEFSHQEIAHFTPLQVTVQRVFTDKRPDELETYSRSPEGLEGQIHELRTEIHAKDKRLKEYAKLLGKFDIEDTVRDIPLIEHKPIKNKPKKDDGESGGGSDRVN
jgi:hypothetical protein